MRSFRRRFTGRVQSCESFGDRRVRRAGRQPYRTCHAPRAPSSSTAKGGNRVIADPGTAYYRPLAPPASGQAVLNSLCAPRWSSPLSLSRGGGCPSTASGSAARSGERADGGSRTIRRTCIRFHCPAYGWNIRSDSGRERAQVDVQQRFRRPTFLDRPYTHARWSESFAIHS